MDSHHRQSLTSFWRFQVLIISRLSILYAKFRSENYSTEYTRATLLDPVTSSTGLETLTGHEAAKSTGVPTLPSTMYTDTSLAAGNGLLRPSDSTFPRTHEFVSHHMQDNAQISTTSLSRQFDGFEIGSNMWNTDQSQHIHDSGPPASPSFQDLAWPDLNLGTDYGGPYITADPWVAEIPYSTLSIQRTNSGVSAMLPSCVGEQQPKEKGTAIEHPQSSTSGKLSLSRLDEWRDSGMEMHECGVQPLSSHAKVAKRQL